MKKQIKLMILLLLGLGFLQAQSALQLRSAEITISGTSSLHDWTSTTQMITATGDLTIENGTLVDIPSLMVTIPVATIKSEKGKMMDSKTYKALDSDTHPNITFKLQDINSIEANGNTLSIKATGQLTVAGTTKTVQLTAKAKSNGNGVFQISGSKALKMSDFGVDPPTALLGTLKTGDDITIGYNLSLATAGKESSN